ncbi:MAG: TlpA family protein disulfide reductase [Gemmatimonadaceae bacterium]|nr:TlpA family protein disulfide reductase [Gemmatimonadaceae bacterium]
MIRPHATMIVAAFALLSACAPGERGPVQVGDVAPEYGATLLTGDSVSTAQLEGKVVLLNVWATWCAPCRQEIPYLQKVYDANKSRGLEIVGVSIDARGSDESINEFAREFGMTYPIWRDPDERVQSLYMALGVPASYLIDRRGVLRWKHLGTVKPTDTAFTAALERALGGD